MMLLLPHLRSLTLLLLQPRSLTLIGEGARVEQPSRRRSPRRSHPLSPIGGGVMDVRAIALLLPPLRRVVADSRREASRLGEKTFPTTTTRTALDLNGFRDGEVTQALR